MNNTIKQTQHDRKQNTHNLKEPHIENSGRPHPSNTHTLACTVTADWNSLQPQCEITLLITGHNTKQLTITITIIIIIQCYSATQFGSQKCYMLRKAAWFVRNMKMFLSHE